LADSWDPALGPTTVKIDPAHLERLHQLLIKESQASEAKTTNKYEAFRIAFTGGLVIAYETGKIVVNGEKCQALVAKALERMGIEETGYDFTIGSDEAGKGEWLGPMVVAAVALTAKQSGVLRSLGVMDSKALSQKKIGELKEKVIENATAVRTVLISPQTFNERMDELHDEGKSLNDLLAWAHAKVIGEVHSQLSHDHAGSRFEVVIDEFSKLKTEERLSRVLTMKEVEVIQRPRAEDEMAVAAASIVARALRNEWVDSTSKRLGIDLLRMTPEDAIRRSDRDKLIKTGYLKKLVG
jgi:ribonuclease HIII